MCECLVRRMLESKSTPRSWEVTASMSREKNSAHATGLS
jgi:hypothetical protein